MTEDLSTVPGDTFTPDRGRGVVQRRGPRRRPGRVFPAILRGRTATGVRVRGASEGIVYLGSTGWVCTCEPNCGVID